MRYVNIALAYGLTEILLESFLALAFNNSILHHPPLDWSSDTYWAGFEEWEGCVA